MPENIKRDRSYPACGRLIVMQTKGDSLLDNYKGFAAINFPAMPDVIELTRRADYMVSTPYGLPDGVHQYRGTSVLEIPVSFKLHAFDREYCPKGVKTLLQVAADLQSLVLPFGPAALPVLIGPPPVPDRNDTSTLKGADRGAQLTYQVVTEGIFPPATCYLELVITDRRSPGIACVGYVKEVSIKFSGPYLRGPEISQLLPTAGDFSFTFVHHPSHSNGYNAQTDVNVEQHAFADTVKERLYNTRDLITGANFKAFRSATGT